MNADLARDVLVHWALPLLARARCCADAEADRLRTLPDELADPGDVDRARSFELLADDIAALIGHSVTDQAPAPELAEVLAALRPPTTWGLPGRSGTREHFWARVARSATRNTPEPVGGWGLGAGPCDSGMVHYFGPRDAPVAGLFDVNGHPRNCPAHREPVQNAPEPSPHDMCRCRTCYRVIVTDHADFFVRGRWRHATPGAAPDGHKAEPTEHAPGEPFCGVPYACDGCGDRPQDGTACVTPSGMHTWRPLPAPERPAAPKSGESPAATETPAARAARLDREARDAGAAYRAALQAADEAHRVIGGRP